jgi:putative transposase
MPALRRPLEAVLHASGPYRAVLERHGITPSMSRRGNCLDNALASWASGPGSSADGLIARRSMESFFASLKKEHVHQARFRSREEAKAAVFDYIEIFHNRQH